MANGESRKAGDRRRVRKTRVVSTAHTGRAAGNLLAGTSRVAEFKTGFSSGNNGRA